MTAPRRGKKALGQSFAASALIQAVNIATGVILARKLGPSSRGELAAIILWPSILATVGSLGVSDATTYFAARKTGRVGALLGSILAVALGQSVVLTAIGAAVYPFVFTRHGGGDIGTAYMYLAFIPIYLVYVYVICLLNGLHEFLLFNALRLCAIRSALGIFALTVFDSLTVRTAVVAYLSGNVVALLAGLGIVLHRIRPHSLRVDMALTRQVIAYGLRVTRPRSPLC